MKFSSIVIFSAVSVATATRQLQATCAPEGERSQQCGATNTDRPAECCPGLICQFAKCVKADSITTCAAQGEKALECGVNQPSRPDKCCEGLICDALKFCSPIAEVPTAEPTVFIPPTPACAGLGDRAQDCGAANTDRPQSCCGDLVCEVGASVRCVENDGTVPAPAPTAGSVPAPAPTAGSVPAPAPTAGVVEPTASVTFEPSVGGTGVPGSPEPTGTMGDDTDAPTGGDITPPTPPSSASKLTAFTAAVAVVVAAPLLL